MSLAGRANDLTGALAMNRYLFGCIASLLGASVRAETLEPAIESSPIATIAFIVLFVGFCAGFAWMVWRKKDKE
jgi:hypothetical protein